MSDLVEWLEGQCRCDPEMHCKYCDAAAEIAALRAALWLARDYVDANGGGWCRDGVGDRLVLKHIDAALKGDKP